MAEAFTHFIMTRYFTKYSNAPADLQAVLNPDRAWLADRLVIFRKYCLPSILAQTNQNFIWLIYFDIRTPQDYLDEVRAVIGDVDNIRIVMCDGLDPETRTQSIDQEMHPRTPWLLTTRLDTDDGIHADFVKVLQENLQCGERRWFNYPVGILYFKDMTFLLRHLSNPFLSLLEPTEGALTACCTPHNSASSVAPIVQLPEMPAFLQVVHGRNRSNKPRGVRVPYILARAGFEQVLPLVPPDPSEGEWRIVGYNLLGPVAWMLRDRAITAARRTLGAVSGRA